MYEKLCHGMFKLEEIFEIIQTNIQTNALLQMSEWRLRNAMWLEVAQPGPETWISWGFDSLFLGRYSFQRNQAV